jgi:hypothetical protein
MLGYQFAAPFPPPFIPEEGKTMFEEADLIHRYSRTDAIRDGVRTEEASAHEGVDAGAAVGISVPLSSKVTALEATAAPGWCIRGGLYFFAFYCRRPRKGA